MPTTPDPNAFIAEAKRRWFADAATCPLGCADKPPRNKCATCFVHGLIASLAPAREEHGTLAALRLAEAALVDLYACDREDCTEPNCNHALVAVRAALRQHATPPIAGCEVCADVPPELLARWPCLKCFRSGERTP